MSKATKLGAAGREAAQIACEALAARGEVTKDMEPAIMRYAKASDLADRAWSEIPADTLLSTGSTGQLVPHPAIALALQADQQAARCAKELGIESQGGKSRAGRPVGAVSAPDRASAPPRLKVVSE